MSDRHPTPSLMPGVGLVSLVLALLLAGCAGLPYIENTRPRSIADKTDALSRNTLEYALEYADDTYDAYGQKLVEEFQRQQAVSTGLLGLAAGLFAAGTYGADVDVLLGGAIGGGLIYQLGTWNSNKDRLHIYMEGRRAMTCAKDAIVPVALSPGQIQLVRLSAQDTFKAHDAASDAAATTTAMLAIASTRLPGKPALLESAESELAEIDGIFERAHRAIQRSAALERKANDAPAYLVGQIDRIRTDIDDALRGTLSDLSALREHIGAISAFANQFSPLGAAGNTFRNDLEGAGAARNEGTGIVTNAESGLLSEMLRKDGFAPKAVGDVDIQFYLADALGDLRGRRQDLIARTAHLEGLLDPADLDTIKQRLEPCRIDTSGLVRPITLDPDEVTIPPKKAGMKIVDIQGGTRPYHAAIRDFGAAGIKVHIPVGSSELQIITSEQTVEGSVVRVRVSDATQRDAGGSASLLVRIAEAAAGGSEPVVQPTVTDAPTHDCQVGSLTRDEICLIQRVVGTAVDGKFGKNTCDAVKAAWATTLGITPQDGLRVDLMNDALMNRFRTVAGLDPVKRGAGDAAIRAGGWHCEGSRTANDLGAASSAPVSSEDTALTVNPNSCENATAADTLRSNRECLLTSDQIRAWSTVLRRKGFNDALDPANNVLGTEFRKAIVKLQQSRGLPHDDGRIDQKTVEAIDALVR